MIFSDLVEKVSSYGPGGYYLVESFVLRILGAEAKSLGQSFEYKIGGGNVAAFDANAPAGLSDIAGPVVVEIVRSTSVERLMKEVSRHKIYSKGSGSTLLLVCPYREVGSGIRAIAKKIAPTEKIVIWGGQEIQLIVDKHTDVAKSLSENIFTNHLKIAINRGVEDWRAQRSTIVRAIRDQYRTGRFSMLLGAGVSSSAGLPDWDTLLNSLFVSMLTKDDSEKNADSDQISSIVKRLRQIDGPSALMLARYIRKGISSDSTPEQEKFVEAVTEKLYGLRNKSYSLSSVLIKAIANLCVPTRTGANVRSVITYNFDDLLERELRAQELSHKSIYEEVDIPSVEELPIYHVHGFLPESREGYENIRKATLVFSEEGYHQIYKDSYHWSNLIHLNVLKETSCLLIGLSLTDPNLRRLLEISAKSLDKPKHFAFMKRMAYDSFIKDGDKTVVRAPVAVVKTFLERHHLLNEEVMRELGINIVWYEKYEEIPEILREIKIA